MVSDGSEEEDDDDDDDDGCCCICGWMKRAPPAKGVMFSKDGSEDAAQFDSVRSAGDGDAGVKARNESSVVST